MSDGDRFVEIAESAARLTARGARLVIEVPRAPPMEVPLQEIGVVVLAHPAAMISHAALGRLAESGAVVVCSDERHMPVAMLQPMVGHHRHAERLAKQAAARLPTRKRLWQQVVVAKIRAQARLLEERTGSDHGLGLLAGRVRSGDPDNVEAQAARRYWPALFGPEFRRDRFAADQNRLLNYGYAVLRATVARAVVGSGLHPAFGIAHRGVTNPFALADDLMEPFRPCVDRAVAAIVDAAGREVPMDQAIRGALVSAVIEGRVRVGGERRTLPDATRQLSASFAGVLLGTHRKLILPEP